MTKLATRVVYTNVSVSPPHKPGIRGIQRIWFKRRALYTDQHTPETLLASSTESRKEGDHDIA